MARKFRLLDNPLGMKVTQYATCRVKGGARTHVFKGGAAICGAGRTRDGEIIPGAVKRSAKKEVDCLRCIKILKLDPALTGSPTTVEYDGLTPVRSRVKGLTVRKFKPSGRKGEKRTEHVMVVGGRAGEEIGKRKPKGAKAYRRSAPKMMRLVDRRAYQAREISAKYGPHHVRAENEDGSRAFHQFRTGKLTKIKVARGKHRGKETYIGHPTQTVTSVYPWLARPVPAERPAAVPRRRVAAAATRANPAGFRTMAEIRAANKAAGMHYFDPKTMKFFASKIEGGPYGGHYFVTSEKTGFDSRKRAYTVRKAEADGSIVTVGEFLGFAHKEDAVDHARALARRKNPSVSFRTKSGRAVSFKTKKR